MALIAGHRDDRETAARHLRLFSDSGIDSDRGNAHYVLRVRSLAAEQAGYLAEAVDVLAECLDAGVVERLPGVWSLMPPLARLALAAGDRDTAAAAARLAVVEAGYQSVPFKVATADHCRGLVEGDPMLVLSAADYFLDSGRPFYRAEALENAAALEAGRGELAAAERYLVKAVGLYSALGAAWDIERAGARLRPFGVRVVRGAFRGRHPVTRYIATA